ncbi:hypothetical protein C0J52_18615, partial [Blattella germanica]
GSEDIKKNCIEFNYIFRLKGDRLIEVKGIKHHIPTPGILEQRPITLKSYRRLQQHQENVNKQKITSPSSSS